MRVRHVSGRTRRIVKMKQAEQQVVVNLHLLTDHQHVEVVGQEVVVGSSHYLLSPHNFSLDKDREDSAYIQKKKQNHKGLGVGVGVDLA
jgi:hypothetical protein